MISIDHRYVLSSNGDVDNFRELKAVLQTLCFFIPKDVAQVEQEAFSALVASWLKDDSINFVRKSLTVDDAAILQLFDEKPVHPLVDQFNGEQNRRLLIGRCYIPSDAIVRRRRLR